MSYKTHKLLIIREHLGSPLVFGGVVLLNVLVFCVLFCLFSSCLVCSMKLKTENIILSKQLKNPIENKSLLSVK